MVNFKRGRTQLTNQYSPGGAEVRPANGHEITEHFLFQLAAAQNKLKPSGEMLMRPPTPGRGPREPGIHLPASERVVPSSFAPGTLKARRFAGSTVWASAPLGF